MTNCSERYSFRQRGLDNHISDTPIQSVQQQVKRKPLLNRLLNYKMSSSIDDYEVLDEKLPLYQNEQQHQRKQQTGLRKLKVVSKLALLLSTSIVVLNYLSFTNYNPLQGLNPYENEFNITELSDAYLNVLQHSNFAGDWLKKYTSEAHLGGTNYGLVEFTAEKFEEFGFESKIDTVNSYINYPGTQHLKLLNSKGKLIYQPTLVEDELEEDPTTSGEGLVPAFHGYSANGNVTGPIVFANYGTKEDFRLLESKGVSVKDSIVIVRYGKIFRGLKVKFAQEAGAIGVIIYSDPADDYIPDDVEPYPKGPGRNPSSIQRGSVQFLSSLPGDPSRFTDRSPEALANLSTIPHIPSLPISYKEAQPILIQLNGHGLDLDFHGGINNFTYTTGPSKAELNIYNNNTYKFTDLWNVLGYLEGHDSNEVIILGNHRDAWIKGGAADPNSGSATILEIARGLGELKKLGWKPQKSILFASWDGEEYGLLGSTGFAEKFAKELGKKVVSYINLDGAVSGSHLHISSSPLINQFLLDIADQVSYPKQANQTLKKHFLSERNISILGSGSDYTSFYEHLGIPSFDLGFGGGKDDAVYHYHSNYDSYHWIKTFVDPDFKLHNSIAQYIGLLIINFSEQKVLQAYKANDYSKAINEYFDELVNKIPNDWFHKSVVLEDEDEEFIGCAHHRGHHGHHSNFTLSSLINSTYRDIHGFNRVSKHHDKYASILQKQWDEDYSKSKNPFRKIIFNRRVKNANNKLKHLEKEFLYEPGLNGRDWFKHVVFASGRYTGYAGQKLPGLTEAIEDKDFEQTSRWIGIIKKSIKQGLISLV
ncbi:glutamate carboxypeptidase II [Wickerhamomyces ciferrii]|uniref:Glutamate carboxypeptidase II n=1 Tax=Wickerhamomyces ciferrii (strain ATCC 14091 / BCRC 22168 / CBS 111 / JCM 3599 / NBRC 0793 / NRRL Y-1031 F-60-10) TaxID=1206466 RepID=K0KIA7_WICCF|nr:glutamate carboxypeptidase II [Wickerhamomyces ciferrii]CCH40883.1 glutamate carboxypeptidase II [Wickerhamomyces ciferrii]